MDLTIMSITELKAVAYDVLVQIEQQQNNLRLINQEIAKKSLPAPTPVADKTEGEPA